MDTLVIVIAVIVAVIIGAMLTARIVRRSVTKAGGRYGRRTAAARIDAILDGLGTTLVIHAAGPVAREIVDRVVSRQPRRFSLLGDGGYGIRFIEADDAVVRLVDDLDGTRMQVERSTERLGMPQNAEFWADLRSRVTSEAGAQEVSVADGIRHGFIRDDDDPTVWTISAAAQRP